MNTIIINNIGSSSSNTNSNDKDNKKSNIVNTCMYKFVIISYTLISLMIDTLEEINFKVIIADECHYLKNANAARTKGVVTLLNQAMPVALRH